MRSCSVLKAVALPLLLMAPPTAALLPLAAPVLGGESDKPGAHKKCAYSTQECLNAMNARMKAAGWVGIEYQAEEATGRVVVQRVVPGSPAEKAGLREDDILIAMDGVEIKKENEKRLAEIRKTWKPGKSVQYTIRRDGEAKKIDIVLGNWPADLLARYLGEHMLEHAEEDAAMPPPPPPAPAPPAPPK